MQIVSLLPSATEILFALGFDAEIVGVSHDCDFPLLAKERPVVIHSRIAPGTASAEIDRLVRGFVERNESVYTVDGPLLRQLAPDLIVTQDLCLVCAASPHDLAGIVAGFDYQPKVLSLNPRNLTDVWRDITQVGEVTGRDHAAGRLVAEIKSRLAAVQRQVDPNVTRRRVAFLEWLDPLYVGGHWVPEMISLAGGDDIFGRAGEPSFRIEVKDLIAAAPETIVLAPCGYDATRAAAEYEESNLGLQWREIPAVRHGDVYAFEANSYASRPGPRLVTGVEALAKILHPNTEVSHEASCAFRRIDTLRGEVSAASVAREGD